MSLIWPSCPLLNLLNIYADVHDKDFLFQMSKRSISRNCHHHYSKSEIKTISFEGDMLVVVKICGGDMVERYVGGGGEEAVT